jgi:hypothetical protein
MSSDIPRHIEARRGFSVSYKGKTLLSTVDPITQGERVVGLVPKIEQTLYLCPSPLYGYGLQTLLNDLSPGSAVLCIEADEQLFDLSARAMEELLRQNPSLRLIGICQPEMICTYVRNTWGSRRFRRLEVLRLSGGWQLYADLYESLAEVLRRNIATDWSNALTLMKLGRRYIRNAIRNFALIPKMHSFADLSFGDSSVLVLGAGPSLDMVLDELQRTCGKELYEITRSFKIICVDTCLQALKDRNIRPDLVVALECQHWNLRDFIGLDSWEVPVAMDLSALPATRDVLGGHIFLFATPWTELRLFRRLKEADLLPEIFPPLGSVGLTAVAVAQRVSSGSIIIGGLDFSYTLDSFHARSTPGHREKLRRQTRFRSILNVETVCRHGVYTILSKSGLPVWSDPGMKNYRDLFEQEFVLEPRIRDIASLGLSLGIKALSPEQALSILQENKTNKTLSPPIPGQRQKTQAIQALSLEKVEAFIHKEKNTLLMLRNIMVGNISRTSEQLEDLLDECDYLWAHFPECAGTGGYRPLATDISFLKRVRIEIDPLVRLFELTLKELRDKI